MKIWQKASNESSDNLIHPFTVGKDKEFDIMLAKVDVQASMAHAKMLYTVGLLEIEDFTALQKGLQELLQEIEEGHFQLSDDAEDIHSHVEIVLTERIGEAGKMLHTGRTRNDQVATDIKLFLRDKIEDLGKKTILVFDCLMALSEAHKDTGMPGYTHLQVAMPSSFGMWFSAYAESLIDDLEMVVGARNLINKNPLGSGAGYGSNFPLDRSITTRLLSFRTMNYNSLNAQMSRGKAEKALASSMAFLAGTLNKLSMDCCLFMNENYRFISFPDNLTTGSSIMPHKKNPDVWELIRARCNRIQSLPNELTLLITNLPSGYHRDVQLTKEILFPAIDELIHCMDMACIMLQHIQVHKNILSDDKYKYLFTVEAINNLVQKGITFRDAYRQIGLLVQSGTFTGEEDERTIPQHPHEGSIYRLCLDEISQEMDRVKGQLGL